MFDSSMKLDRISCNDQFPQGPKSINRLAGILLDFRKNAVAFMDLWLLYRHYFINFVFTSKLVRSLRCLWFSGNDDEYS